MTRCFALLAVLLLAVPLLAQGEAAREEGSADDRPALPKDALKARQAEVAEQVRRIEETMDRIADQLAARNPDEAARLRMAWQRSKEDRNAERVREILDLLEVENFSDALAEQKALEESLRRLLDTLLDRDAERKEMAEEIERLQGVVENLDQLIQREKDHQLQTEQFADPEKTLQRAAAARAKLADLVAREKEIEARAAADPAQTPDRALEALAERLRELQREQRALQGGASDADAQEELAARAEQLAGDVAREGDRVPAPEGAAALGRRNPAAQAADALGRAAGQMRAAAGSMRSGGAARSSQERSSQKTAEQDLREASEALERLGRRLDRQRDADLAEDQERIRKDTGRLREEMERLERGAPGTDSGSGSLREAEGDMEAARRDLEKGARERAQPRAESAREKLERAYEQLERFEEELKRLTKLPDYEKLAEEQDETAEETGKLLDRMPEAQPEGGDPQGTPGREGVENAKKAMQRASRNLRGKSAKRANSDQREAVDRLEKAREELEEALRQLREEEQLMLLDAIERRLVKMMRAQTALYKRTISLHIRLRDAEHPARADRDLAAQLGDGEAELAGEADKLLALLREEGSTIVIPDVVSDLRADLDGLARRLRGLDAGAYTQQIQQDVIATLKELIEVVEEEQRRREGGRQQQGGQDPMEGDQEENLLPTSAELKMLKSLQQRVNRRTEQFARMREPDDAERERLAEKQQSVGNLTRTMADKLNREEDS